MTILTSFCFVAAAYSNENLLTKNLIKLTQQDSSKLLLYLGNSADGQKLKTENLSLNLRTENNDNSSNNFKVESWILNYEGKESLSGTGNTFTKAAIDAILNSKKGTKIVISTVSNTKKVTTATFIR
jgi:hypothetical protein